MEERLAPIHPGEVLLEDFLRPMGLSQNKLARDLNVPTTRIQQIVVGRRGVSTDTALRLAAYFGSTPEFWLNLQMRYEIQMARYEDRQAAIAREVRPLRRDPALV